jgi:hypothetical protein
MLFGKLTKSEIGILLSETFISALRMKEQVKLEGVRSMPQSVD